MKYEDIPFWDRERGGGPVTDVIESRERLRRKFLAEMPPQELAIRLADAIRSSDAEAEFVLTEECERRGVQSLSLRKALLQNAGVGTPCMDCGRGLPKHWQWCGTGDEQWEA